MTPALLIYGLCTNTLLSVIVGLFGAKREIGFGWTFLISVVLSPIIGIVAVLVSEKLSGNQKKWGCLGILLGGIVIVAALLVGLAILGAILV